MPALLRRISPGVWIALLFLLAGLAFIRKTGMHYDASLELACFYKCGPPVYSIALFGDTVPVMVLPYLGALKAWLFRPALEFLEAEPFMLRFPTLLIAAASV